MSRAEEQKAGLIIQSFMLYPEPTNRENQGRFLIDNGMGPEVTSVEAIMANDIIKTILISAYERQHPQGFTDLRGGVPDEETKPLSSEDAVAGELGKVWSIMKSFRYNDK